MFQKIHWKVLEWKKLGKTIWFPTANAFCNNENISDGTYRINIIIDWKKYAWIWAFLSEKKLFEAHIFDFDEDIYSKEIEIYVLYKIRENKKFSSLDELKNQISKDRDFAKNKEIVVMTFWTFDFFHEGHKYFLNYAKIFWDKLITIIATDKNVFKIKWFLPKFNELERKNEVEKSGISDTVFVWNEENPMYFIEKYKPDVVCLWYDQTWFTYLLKDFILKNNLKTQIIRIESYKPEIYKSSILKKNLLSPDSTKFD